MTLGEKLEVAEFARHDGRRHHRSRFPDRSIGISRPVSKIASLVKNATVAGLLTRRAQGYRPGGGSGAATLRARVSIPFSPASPVHMKFKLQLEPEAVLET